MIIFIITYFQLNCPPGSVLYILFLEAATENCSLKLVFPETKQIL